MPTTTRKPLIEPAEIPLGRLFRPSDNQTRRMVESGIPPGNIGSPFYPLDLDRYHKMVAEGILGKDDRLELLGGWLVTKMSINPPHQTSLRKVRWELNRIVPRGWFADQDCPISLPISGSEPEPDVLVIRGAFSDYREQHPGPLDLALVVEVASTSLAEDRGYKKRLYATDSIQTYWIVNLVDQIVEVYTEPSGLSDAPDYGVRQDFHPGQLLPVMIDGLQVGVIAVIDLLA